MLTPEERKAIQAKLDELQPRITELKQRLKELHGQKEEAFQQRGSAGKEISQHIQHLKQYKQQRNVLTQEVRKLKDTRHTLNAQIKEKISEAKNLNEEKKKSAPKTGVRENPSHLKSMIARLDQKIETEVMSFDREKAIMKEIKDLKKRYDAIRKASGVWQQSHHLSKEIDVLKKKADSAHHELQQKAKQSQEKHEGLVSESKKVDNLRGPGKEFTKSIGEKKSEIDKLNKELDGLIAKQKELRSKIDSERKQHEAERVQQQKKKFSEKLAEVKKKLVTGGKLTTEDIIIMQGEK